MKPLYFICHSLLLINAYSLLQKFPNRFFNVGIAEANKIIAGSITTEYIRYKFIEGLNDGNTEVIYVPTEANLPILEARNQ